jgi:hypothetical protein
MSKIMDFLMENIELFPILIGFFILALLFYAMFSDMMLI